MKIPIPLPHTLRPFQETLIYQQSEEITP
jgi:hypothetical protein